MDLTLSVVSFRGRPQEPPLSITLEGRDGTIGRSVKNNLILPDDEYTSRIHAKIHYRDGEYYIEDTSANGVFINDSPQRLGQGNTAKLQAGDQLIIGEYTIVVVLVPTEEGDWKILLGAPKTQGEETDVTRAAPDWSQYRPDAVEKFPKHKTQYDVPLDWYRDEQERPKDSGPAVGKALPKGSKRFPSWSSERVDEAPYESSEPGGKTDFLETSVPPLPKGTLVYNAPDRMRVRNSEIIEARVAPEIVKGLLEDFDGKGELIADSIPIASLMRLHLHGDPSVFRIHNESDNPQLLYEQHKEFAEWRWRVLPIRRGKHTLRLTISGETVGKNGLSGAIAFEPIIRTIRVTINPAYAATQLVKWLIPLTAAAAIGAIAAEYAKKLIGL
jgi:pSer/pThr/pTyr-binding forkhead associated (FHA) protein